MLFNNVNANFAAEFYNYILWVEGHYPQYFLVLSEEMLVLHK